MPRTKLARPTQREATTLRLKVPRMDWPAVVCGEKRQFRLPVRMGPDLRFVDLPRPVVAYTLSPLIGEMETRLMVVTAFDRGPLGAITQEDIELEGFANLPEFRRYWKHRFHRTGGFKPLMPVNAYTLRPWAADDAESFGRVLLEHLYGEYLP